MIETTRFFSQRAARALLYCLLFTIPLSVAAIEILFPLLLIAWLLGWSPGIKRGSSSIWSLAAGRTVLTPLLIYIAICAVSVLFSTDPVLSLTGLVGKTLEYILFFLIASDVVDRPLVARRCVRILLGSALVVGLYALLQQIVGHDPILNRPLVYGRMVGPYRNPNDLATFLLVILIIVAAQIVGNRKRLQMGHCLLGALLIYCLVKTLSRGALVGLVPALFLLFLIFPLPKWLRWTTASAVLLMGALIFLHKGQLTQVLSFSDSGSMERKVMWEAAWRMIQDQPLTGTGLNTFMANYLHYTTGHNQGPAYAHNCFLQIAAETGIMSLAFFLLFLGVLFSTYWCSLKKTLNLRWAFLRPVLSGLAIALFAFLIQSAFDTNLYSLRQATLFWTLAGVAFGTSQMMAQRSLSQDSKNRKIVRIITRMNIGGPAQQAAALSDRLTAFGWQTLLITGRLESGEGDMRYLLMDRVRTVDLPSLRRKIDPVRDPRAFWSILRRLWIERPILLHTHTAKAGALGRAAGGIYRLATGAPLVMVHTFHGHIFDGYFSPAAARIFCGIERFLARFTDSVIAVSPTVKKELVALRIAPSKKIRVIPLAPSLDRFLKMDPPTFQGPLGVGLVGRLTPIKNHRLLFEAARILREAAQLNGTQFLLVGDGELRPSLESAVNQMNLLPHVQFLGWQTDLPSVYRSFHILCITSKNEGTPVAVLEAMAAARPVVATDVGGVRDLLGRPKRLESTGTNGGFEICERGILVPSEDAQTLSEALQFLMTHPEVGLQMGAAGREFVRHSFSPEQLDLTIHQLYLKLSRRWLC
ncbi:MAG: glycosyltransferase [Candidatus Omnitrophica bacterium]|nr:glycosyltransferase [Candidatus Omnitrophota bacterium]